MAQFDVVENTSVSTKGQFPFLLEVQSDVFEDSTRAVYIPLVLSEALKKPDNVLNARFTVDGVQLRLFPLDIASAPRSVGGRCVGSVKAESDSVVAALDLLFARF